MAGYLSEAGHRVTVFNRTAEKAERWCGQYQGRRAATPSEAVKDADAVFTCLGDDPDVREVVLAPGGVLESMPSGSLYVDHTTASAGLRLFCLPAPTANRAIVDRKSARRSAVQHMIASFFGGSRSALVQNLLDDDKMDVMEIERLKSIVRESEP